MLILIYAYWFIIVSSVLFCSMQPSAPRSSAPVHHTAPLHCFLPSPLLSAVFQLLNGIDGVVNRDGVVEMARMFLTKTKTADILDCQ